jgi:flagellar biosynthetic protein FliO
LKNLSLITLLVCATCFSLFPQEAAPVVDETDAAATGTTSPETAFVFSETGAEGETDENAGFGAGQSIFALLRVLLVLALVAAAIYGLVFFLRKRNTGQTQTDPYLKILARTPITPKAAAVIIAVGGKAWLTGITDERISLITEITDKEIIDTMLLDAAARETATRSQRFDFRALLAKWQGSAASPQNDSEPGVSGGFRAHAERLGKL